MKKELFFPTAVLSLLASSSAVEAGGFALKEQSTRGLATAFSGSASGAYGPSSMFFNPATLGLEKSASAEFVGSFIAPVADLKSATATVNAAVGGGAIVGPSTDSDFGEDAIIPALYGSYALDNGWSVGIGVNVPFGLETNYEDDWVGRYHGTKSAVSSINVNPAIAYSPVSSLTLGAGLQLEYIDADLRSAVDFGTIGASFMIPGSSPGNQDGSAKITGDDVAIGFTFGVLFEPAEGTRFGLGYRSKLDHELDGDADFTLDGAGIGAAISGASGSFVDTGASAAIETPALLSLGFSQAVGEKLTIMAEAQWTGWSTFEELRIEFDNPAQADSVTAEDWNNVWFLSLGTEYRLTEEFALRGGIAFDQSPVTDSDRTPRIPDGDRAWIALGGSYAPSPNIHLDLSYAHIFVDDTEVNLTTDGEGNAARGNLRAEYETSIDILAVSAKIKF